MLLPGLDWRSQFFDAKQICKETMYFIMLYTSNISCSNEIIKSNTQHVQYLPIYFKKVQYIRIGHLKFILSNK